MSSSLAPEDFGPDGRRFSAIAIFLLLCSTQGANFCTFSSVAVDYTQENYKDQGVTAFTVNMFMNWSLIIFVPALVPAMWMHSQRPRGLIWALRLAAVCNGLGAVLRCFDPVILAHLGQILIGVAGPFVWNACASFASTWFPLKERTAATAVGNASSFLGPAIQFLLVLPVKSGPGLRTLLVVEAVASGLAALLIFTLLPDRPVRPPTQSAAVAEARAESTRSSDSCASIRQFASDLKLIASRPSCWLVGLAVGVPTGFFGVYSYSFSLIFDATDEDPFEVWLGFASSVAFVVGMLGITFLADGLFARRLKLLAILCFLLGVLSFLAFMLSLPSPFSETGIASDHILAMLSMILGSVAMGSLLTLGVELVAELAFPAEESAVVGMVTGLNMVSGIGYLLVMDKIEARVANLPVLTSTLGGLLLMLFVRESYDRRELDTRNAEHGDAQRRVESEATKGSTELAEQI